MSVWFAIPSKRQPEEAEPVLKLWRERGYKIALYRDDYTDVPADELLVALAGYPGYARATNMLIAHVLKYHADAEWIVTGGDDVEPDPNHTAEEIARECKRYFKNLWKGTFNDDMEPNRGDLSTFGVMQPTGDRWGEQRNTHPWESWPDQPLRCIRCGQEEDSPPHAHGAYIDRVAGSPWLGRAFCERMYGGKGPYWPEYTHMGVDEELQAVALKMGVLWQRRDLTHYHRHWGRAKEGHAYAEAGSMPEFLKHANTATEWDRFKAIFAARKAAGFPGSEPLA